MRCASGEGTEFWVAVWVDKKRWAELGLEGIRGGTFDGFTGVSAGWEPTLKLVWVCLFRVGLEGAAAG
jgi:hypothetical protein